MTEQSPIRVMIVDDHDMVRRGLAVFLLAFSDLELVGEADNGKEAIRLCAELAPDVILMDMVMPEMDGATATRIIRERYPNTQIIALTSFKEDSLVTDALQSGAISYLMKNVTIDDLADAIRSAHAGMSVLSPEATKVLIESSRRPPTPGHDLTDREQEVLAQMVLGLNNPEIAEKLGVSRATIKTHVSHILDKLGVPNRLEAVKLAIEHKLVA